MSKRNSDRVKVVVNWTYDPNDHTSYVLHNKLEEDLIGEYQSMKCGYMVRPPKLTTIQNGGNVTTTFHLFHKRKSPLTRQHDWRTLLSFVIRVLHLGKTAPKELGVTVTVDMQKNRMPWVFHDDMDFKSPTNLYLRPGYVKYDLELSEVTELPSLNDKFYALMDISVPVRKAEFIRIYGEPVAAYKAYRFYKQLLRGATIDPAKQLNLETKIAIGDLVCVLYRETENQPWSLLDNGTHVLGSSRTWGVLMGDTILKGYEHMNLGLDYQTVSL